MGREGRAGCRHGAGGGKHSRALASTSAGWLPGRGTGRTQGGGLSHTVAPLPALQEGDSECSAGGSRQGHAVLSHTSLGTGTAEGAGSTR